MGFCNDIGREFYSVIPRIFQNFWRQQATVKDGFIVPVILADYGRQLFSVQKAFAELRIVQNGIGQKGRVEFEGRTLMHLNSVATAANWTIRAKGYDARPQRCFARFKRFDLLTYRAQLIRNYVDSIHAATLPHPGK